MAENHMQFQGKEDPDINLIQRARNGDALAFEQLVFKHDRRILSIIASYVNRADDAKDIYQEVLIRVYRGLPKFRAESEFTTWLYRIAANTCLTHRARAGRRSHMTQPLDDEDESGEAHSASSEKPRNPEEELLSTEIRERVDAALATLSPRQRMVFTLKQHEGFKLTEIATMMECTEGTVKRYLFEATQRMKKQLKDLIEEKDESRDK